MSNSISQNYYKVINIDAVWHTDRGSALRLWSGDCSFESNSKEEEEEEEEEVLQRMQPSF